MKLNKVLLIFIISTFVSTSVLASNQDIKITIDGVKLHTDVSPKIINGRTLVPMRPIFEAMGANVDWKSTTKTAIGTKGSDKITLQIGNSKASINGKEVKLDSPAVIINGSTFVPVRFIAESFRSEVAWDNKTKTVTISNSQLVQKVEEDKHIDIKDNLEVKNGYHVYDLPNGATYQGEFFNDIMQGYGLYIWPNGETYEGDFVNNKMHGYGIHLWPNGESYEGDFVNNIKEGQGTYKFLNSEKYVGDIKNSKMHGEGIYYWPNGASYEGDFVNDIKEGYGKYKNRHGQINEGYWLNDEQVVD